MYPYNPNGSYGFDLNYLEHDSTRYYPRTEAMDPFPIEEFAGHLNPHPSSVGSSYQVAGPTSPYTSAYYNDLPLSFAGSSSTSAPPDQEIFIRPHLPETWELPYSSSSIPAAHTFSHGSFSPNSIYSVSAPTPQQIPDGRASSESYTIQRNSRTSNQSSTATTNRGGSARRVADADRICPHCGEGFTRNERLRYHIHAVHLRTDPDHPCDVQGCDRAFRQRSDLVRHQRTVHRDIFGVGR